MESSRSSAQTMTTASSNIVKTFVYIPFVEDSEMTIDLLVQKTVVHNFAYSGKCVSNATVHSLNGIKPFFCPNNDDCFSNIVETFVYKPFVEDSEMRIDLLVEKSVVHNFLRIPQSTFPTLPSTVYME